MENTPNDPISTLSVTSRLGALLVAATSRGVCFVWIGDDEAEGRRRLARALPFAAIAEPAQRPTASLRRWTEAIRRAVDGEAAKLDVPLDVRGSEFQHRVWAALRGIPRGETRSYSEVAREVGSPRGARAVANACARNPAPIVTPCHRVVREDGSLGGFALGPARKRELLEREGARTH